VLFIDLDNFKGINDTLGHDYGDLLLQQVAQRLLGCVRAIDTVARLGGDEFIVMVESLADNPVNSIEQVTLIANKILAKIGQIYQLGEYEYHVTPSIGATVFGTKVMSAESLIKQADAAMYLAKTSGKNKLCFYQQTAVNDA
jgi:diguanylate cyclase (GGDEF)-like protein